MDFSPHSLHEILSRIREQTRCPQCGGFIPVHFPSVKVAVDDFLLLELRCKGCSAYIVLQVQIKEAQKERSDAEKLLNASSTLSVTQEEMSTLKKALEESGGSFDALFGKLGKEGK